MPQTINKQKTLNQILALKSRYGSAEPAHRPVLEQVLYAIIREGATREQADRAFRALDEHFFDRNEIRVSSHREVEEVLGDLPDAEAKAQRLINFLQEVFETTFSFDLDFLQKKGMKLAAKQLARFQAVDDYAVAWVVQHSLASHAVPLDAPSLRVLHRLGLVESEIGDPETVRASIEHMVPKARASLFGDLVNAVADDVCFESDPNCSDCPLHHDCPTGHETRRASMSGRGRSKPR